MTKACSQRRYGRGGVIQTKFNRESTRQSTDSYSLYPGRFTWEVEWVLRTIDRFQGMGVDYRSAVQELRHALDEPTPFEKPKLEAVAITEEWLKKHGKSSSN